MDTAVKGAFALVFASIATFKGRVAFVVKADVYSAVSAAHGFGVLATVASCFKLYGAGLTIARVTGVLANVHAAVELLAASVTTRSAVLVEGREAGLL